MKFAREFLPLGAIEVVQLLVIPRKAHKACPVLIDDLSQAHTHLIALHV